MVACVERGDFRSVRAAAADEDGRGRFTVHGRDVPPAAARRRHEHRRRDESREKKGALTPIHEEGDVSPLALYHGEDTATPIAVCMSPSTHSAQEDLSCLSSRSEPSVPRRQESISRMLGDVADAYEKELENIREDSWCRPTDPSVKRVARELPPRPRCAKMVLPPSVTGSNLATQVKHSKLIKRKTKLSLDKVTSLSPLKHKSSDARVLKCSLKDLRTDRPKSAESGVQVVRLSDLTSNNSNSVPDLPSIINKLSQSEDAPGVPSVDASGALSTPRQSTEKPPAGASWDASCLRGHEISSFYNMWERDRSRRPFDKKETREPGISLNRSCLCAIRQYGLKKCAHGAPKRHFLPPLH